MKKSIKLKARFWRNTLLISTSLLLLVLGCRKDVQIPDSSTSISFNIPQGWPTPFYNFDNNKLTNAGFILGRKLFYETKLSVDNTISCGSCHQSFAAFANLDHPLSHGINNQFGNRNAPTLFNLNWNTSFMWDGGINHLEIQPLAPMQNPVEMGEKIGNIVTKLNNDADYKQLFNDAFGTSEVSSEYILKALAQFMGVMVSSNSKYDQYMRKESGVSFTSSELAGMDIFQQKCASCHPAPLFTDYTFRNAGLQPGSLNDSGRAHITLDPNDLYKFRVPTLRNLKYSIPYTHDGRYNTLDQVLDQMATGIFDGTTLDPLMKTGIQLTAQQRSDLLNFLNTLNDESFIKDKRFQEQQ
jgi:cytochrome c peroxidase